MPSTSTDEMFSPPLMITSLKRSRISDVAVRVYHRGIAEWNQPSRMRSRWPRIVVVALHDDVAARDDLSDGLPVARHLVPCSSTTRTSPDVMSSTPCRALIVADASGDRSASSGRGSHT
jgi:hypothetical protein